MKGYAYDVHMHYFRRRQNYVLKIVKLFRFLSKKLIKKKLNYSSPRTSSLSFFLTLTGWMSHICDTQLLVKGTVVTNT